MRGRLVIKADAGHLFHFQAVEREDGQGAAGRALEADFLVGGVGLPCCRLEEYAEREGVVSFRQRLEPVRVARIYRYRDVELNVIEVAGRNAFNGFSY